MNAIFLTVALSTMIQAPDSLDIYADRVDSLKGTVVTALPAGSYISKMQDIRTEVISSSGLTRLACCTLADSFENSSSVTVGYSDATTGARQIKLLGLGGNYTQMLEETRPVMRGLASPFGLSYIPGTWMESISIAKGATTVRNGAESMSGSINIEKRKPTDEKPLMLGGSVMSDSRTDLNLVSSLQLNDRLSTAMFAHFNGDFSPMDMNGDGFVDNPQTLQFNFADRWFYLADDGTAIQWGLGALWDSRKGGELLSGADDPWTSDILNRQAGAFFKIGHPTGGNGSIAAIADYSFNSMDAGFWTSSYDATQHSAYLNLIYQDEINPSNRYVVGISGVADMYNETLVRPSTISQNTGLFEGGIYGEYTLSPGENFSLIAGLRADYYSGAGLRAVPRLSLRYSPVSDLTIRANAGRGLRHAIPIADNIGMLSTNKTIDGNPLDHTLEDAWTAGGNITWNIGGSASDYLGIDYFHTEFSDKLTVDYSGGASISLYPMQGRAFTDNIQADASFEPVRGLSLSATFRYTIARESYRDRGLVEKPMTPPFKGVINARYALPLNRWIFDGTFSLNGSSRVWDFMESLTGEDGASLYPGGKTPVYPLVYLQVTKRMKGIDIYAGAENLLGYHQKNLLIGDPHDISFDASQVWGPIMGRMIYIGFRYTIWKI